MNRLSVFLFTNILGKKIYDEFDEVIGELKDIYVTAEDGYPRVIGYKVRKDGSIFHYEFRNIEIYQLENKFKIKINGSREILPRTYSYLLSENLLDKNIVDINGKQVVRVDDLRIAKIAGEYRVIAVEAGPNARFRRMGIGDLAKFIYKILKKNFEDKVIMWDDVESLEMVKNNLQISIPYKKLSALHPADLADILEDLDTISRKKIFESLDEDLASDTLEEIEPEYKGTILKELSESKAVELLENMPNDEIADILDELNDEEREKILLNLETIDAKEVKELLKYEDESIGSIMSKDFIVFNINTTVEDILEVFKETEPSEDELNAIFIIDKHAKVIGTMNFKNLILNHSKSKAKDIMNDKVNIVKPNMKVDEAVDIIAKYDLLSVPVVDDYGVLVGAVNTHDIIDEVFYPLWKKNR